MAMNGLAAGVAGVLSAACLSAACLSAGVVPCR